VSDGWTFRVTEMDGRRVKWVNIAVAGMHDDAGEASRKDDSKRDDSKRDDSKKDGSDRDRSDR
jgi:hypothetical protein